jgi:hypothetical protein
MELDLDLAERLLEMGDTVRDRGVVFDAAWILSVGVRILFDVRDEVTDCCVGSLA